MGVGLGNGVLRSSNPVSISCMGTHGDKWGLDPDVVYKALPASMRGAIFVRPPLSTGLELDFVPYIARKQKIYRLRLHRLKNLSIEPMGVPAG